MKKEQAEENKNQKQSKKQTQEELQKTLQEKYMEYQMFEEQVKQIQEQVQTIQKQQEELEGIKDSLEHLSETAVGTELLVPLSSGIFVTSKISDTKTVLMNVGDGVVVPKSMKDALVLGIRYQKKGGTFSEDLFLFRKGKPIQKGYRGELEKIVPEYKGTHKGKPNI